MLYVGTRKQREALVDIIEDIETAMAQPVSEKEYQHMQEELEYYKSILGKKFVAVVRGLGNV